MAKVIMAQDTLDELVRDVGKKFGYDIADAEFCDFKDFKVQWSRSYRYIHFRISDYLADAPAPVIRGFITLLFKKINGQDTDGGYGPEATEWVLNKAFAKSHRATYIKRSKLKKADVRLNEAVTRLQDMGLIDGKLDVRYCWQDANPSKAASSSLLFKVVAVSTTLDEFTPEFVLDYAIYTQYLKISEGQKVFGKTTEVYTRDKEVKFPQYKDAERFLDKRGMHL